MNRSEQFEQLSSEEKRALLAQLLEKAAKPKLAPPSFAQERMGFLAMLMPEDAGFNLLAAVRLKGQLDSAALEQSLCEIVRRHEILRTTFAVQAGQLVQVIAPAMLITLPMVDLGEMAEAEREALARRLAVEENERPFDLMRGPLFRATLLRLGEQEHVVLLNVHHIIFDAWSDNVLKRELAALYEALSHGRPSPLPELPLQYADFARWQRQSFQADAMEKQLAYWKQQLAGPLPVLEMIMDRPSSATRVASRVRQRRAFSPSLSQSLKSLCQQQGVTPFMLMLAAFKTLLHRYTGQTDIIVGTPITHRDRTELEGLMGLFLNTLVLRTDLGGDPTFVELLSRVRQTVLDAFTHKDLPFEQLIQELHPERDVKRNPIFQVMFVVEDPATLSFKLPGFELSPFPIEIETEEQAPNMLGLTIWETAEGLVGSLGFRTELLNQRILEHLQALLEGIAANPQQRLSALPLFLDEERQLLMAWNDTRKSYPKDQCFQQLFQAQCQATPDAVAAACDNDACSNVHLTYEHLNRRANRLAASLVEHNVGPDSIVALLAERGLDFLTAMLAVFKAGGAYLPLDPHYPSQRLFQVLNQSASPLVLTADEFVPALSEALASASTEKRPLVLRLSELLDQERPETDLPIRSTPHHLAYVIYTSGSTGIPKGAMVEQQGMVNHLYAKIGDLGMIGNDILAQTATQTFDISVWQFLAALLVGGCVRIFTDEIAHDPLRLLQEVARHHVTILETVPSLMRAVLEQMALSDFNTFNLAALRWLIPTGEALPPDLARQWLSYQPHIPLVNAYGPTECSDDVTHYPILYPPGEEMARTPIGRPINNMQLYVLDAGLSPMPVGVAGELYVGGDGVGRGYLREPGKTAEAMIPDPFSLEPGARLYKTGDLACWRSDGNLEFLGRIDYQVKVHGFRIELGEIETALERHPQVRQAVAIVREDDPGEKRLVAYIVPGPEQTPATGDLRDWVRKQLPDYMTPSVFVLLDALPLTRSGKVDRKALPAPDASQPARTEEYVPPQGPLEENLAEIWIQTLSVERVGRYDNFFELGGHSLLATQIIYRTNQALQTNLSIRNLFEEPTIAGLGLLIKEKLVQELEQEESSLGD